MQVFIYCKITLHVSGVHRAHHQVYKYCNCRLWYRSLHRYYDLYQRLQFQFFVLLMMDAMEARNM